MIIKPLKLCENRLGGILLYELKDDIYLVQKRIMWSFSK